MLVLWCGGSMGITHPQDLAHTLFFPHSSSLLAVTTTGQGLHHTRGRWALSN
jgi:hypothetical protein